LTLISVEQAPKASEDRSIRTRDSRARGMRSKEKDGQNMDNNGANNGIKG